jgi:hypothetical protein
MNWKIWYVASSAQRPSATTEIMLVMLCCRLVMGAATLASASHKDTPAGKAGRTSISQHDCITQQLPAALSDCNA